MLNKRIKKQYLPVVCVVKEVTEGFLLRSEIASSFPQFTSAWHRLGRILNFTVILCRMLGVILVKDTSSVWASADERVVGGVELMLVVPRRQGRS